MNRRNFIIQSSSAIAALYSQQLFGNALFMESTQRMPVLFVGHGNPMNAIEENKYTNTWKQMVKGIPQPKAIMIVSAHWETKRKTEIYVGEKPKMIYDMYGFPKSLYEVQYPAPGSPETANDIINRIQHTTIEANRSWGFDHGAWSVMKHIYPEANIPSFQISLNNTRDLQWHYDFAKELSYLRDKGVLIICSGNIVHNIPDMMQNYNKDAVDWAQEFDAFVSKNILDGNHQNIINYKQMGRAADLSVNSAEHYIPLLYTLGMQNNQEEALFFNHDHGVNTIDIAMRCLKIG